MTEREKNLAENLFIYKECLPNGTGFVLMEVAFVNGESGSVYYKLSDKSTFIEQHDEIPQFSISGLIESEQEAEGE